MKRTNHSLPLSWSVWSEVLRLFELSAEVTKIYNYVLDLFHWNWIMILSESPACVHYSNIHTSLFKGLYMITWNTWVLNVRYKKPFSCLFSPRRTCIFKLVFCSWSCYKLESNAMVQPSILVTGGTRYIGTVLQLIF